MAKYLDSNGLLYFWQKIKSVFITDVSYSSSTKKITKTKNGSSSDVVTLSDVATSGSYDDLSDKPTIPTVPSAYTSNPAMDGTASAGSSTQWSKGDHVHPHDTSRAPVSHASTSTTYGVGTDANYGHVKLSNSTNSTSGVNAGTAATPKAVSDALSAANTYTDTAVGNIDVGVTGVKGNAESSYRTGNVNITPANIGAATSLHTHGDITSGGDITAAAPTIASGDKLIINDESASKITNGPSFGADTSKFLRNDGIWAEPPGTAGSLVYKGVATAESDITGTSYIKGWYWIVAMPSTTPATTSITIGGVECEAGDMVIAKQDKTSTIANDIDVVQTNISIITNAEIDTIVAA